MQKKIISEGASSINKGLKNIRFGDDTTRMNLQIKVLTNHNVHDVFQRGFLIEEQGQHEIDQIIQ
jgi:hypothetical protein